MDDDQQDSSCWDSEGLMDVVWGTRRPMDCNRKAAILMTLKCFCKSRSLKLKGGLTSLLE